MAARKNNENFIHDCGSEKVEPQKCIVPVTKMGFSEQELSDILNFYLFQAPIMKPASPKVDIFGMKSLKDYGWQGSSDMSKLEGQLLKTSGILMFCIIKADTIKDTLCSMGLNNRICIDHPRAVIQQNYSVSVCENGSVNISAKESRMECLFRHIRNSFAHNRTYLFENGNILLEDGNDGAITARILIPKNTLIEWIKVITSKNVTLDSLGY